ncbi:MAG TPA: hypothetical protein VKF59_19135 [Candidatus Dormibacteraeota bacterium]|nr:hypothetical protein [Candidatus Dormibacteraeota bacterium]
MTEPPAQVSREDLAATLAARQELGPEFEPALVESFAQRLEATIDARLQAALARGAPPAPAPPATASAVVPAAMRLAVAIVSLGVAIPVTAIAGESGGLVGVVVSWAGLVGINAAFALPSHWRWPR